MTDCQLRDFVPSDLEELVRLDDASSTAHQSPVFALSDVVSAVSTRNPAVVAVAAGQIVGAAVGRVEGDQAWLLRLALTRPGGAVASAVR